eukprot:2577643-Pleurochrysis_carterae.AAC.1
MSATGHVAFMGLHEHLTSLILETSNLRGVKAEELDITSPPIRAVIQIDAARRRTRQFVPLVLKNPDFPSQSCFALRLLALGVRFKDDRSGFERLLAPNMKLIKELLTEKKFTFQLNGKSVVVRVELTFTADFAGVRAIEGQLCGCDSSVLHTVPDAANIATPASLAQ